LSAARAVPMAPQRAAKTVAVQSIVFMVVSSGFFGTKLRLLAG
jgi:hypothetical protein